MEIMNVFARYLLTFRIREKNVKIFNIFNLYLFNLFIKFSDDTSVDNDLVTRTSHNEFLNGTKRNISEMFLLTDLDP